jgi:hypothetical protein
MPHVHIYTYIFVILTQFKNQFLPILSRSQYSLTKKVCEVSESMTGSHVCHKEHVHQPMNDPPNLADIKNKEGPPLSDLKFSNISTICTVTPPPHTHTQLHLLSNLMSTPLACSAIQELYSKQGSVGLF